MPSPSPSRVLGVALALLGFAAVTWWLLDSSGTGSDQSGAVPVSAPFIETTAEGIVLPEANPIQVSPFDASLDRADAPEAEEAPSHVLVRDASGIPVAGAEVTLLRPDEGRGPFGAEDRERPLRRLKTDAQGMALISPLPRRTLTIQARTEDALGIADFRQGETPDSPLPDGVAALVVLEPLKFVEVRVTDALRTPLAQVRVTLSAGAVAADSFFGRGVRSADSGQGGGRGGPGGMFASGPEAFTDNEQGLARIELSVKHRTVYESTDITITAHLVGQDSVFSTFPLAPAGVTSAHLETPPSTLLVLQLVDAAGAELREDATLVLQAESMALETRAMGNPFSGSARVQARDGKATVGGVRNGQNLKVTASTRDRATAECVVVLPPSALKHEASVPLGARRASISFIVHDEDNLVVPWFAFNATLRSAAEIAADAAAASAAAAGNSGATNPERTRTTRGGRGAERMAAFASGGLRPQVTDIEGRVRMSVSPEGGTLEIRAQSWRSMMGGADDSSLLASIKVPTLLEGGTADLGVVKLSGLAVLARGRVVDAAGNGVPDISVRATEEDGASNANPAAATARAATSGRNTDGANSGAGGGAPGSAANSGFNRGGRGGLRGGIPIATVDSGKNGVFKLYGPRPDNGRVQLSVSGRDALAIPVTVTAGAKDVVLRLLRTGSIAGTVRLADPGLELPIDIRASAAGLQLREVRTRPDKDGNFVLRGLPQGVVRVRFDVNNVQDLSFAEVKVVGGERTSPAELQGLVVGQSWRQAAVEVRDESGVPVEAASVQLQVIAAESEQGRRRVGGGGDTRRTDTSGRVTFKALSTQDYSLSIRKAGYLTTQIAAAHFPLSTTLERGISINLELPAATAELGERSLRLMLSPAKTELANQAALRTQAGDTPSATVSAADRAVTLGGLRPGAYSLFGILTRGRTNANRQNGRGNNGADGARRLAAPNTRNAGPVMLGTLSIAPGGSHSATFDPAALTALLSTSN
ncbi:MAG: carboxypeptidase regulatory-like domain-containing protein [Planctomycetes bacterium]|nr:carboxypeptidase regulatory-like domain-containing protein [Planctomycetota bacterium]